MFFKYSKAVLFLSFAHVFLPGRICPSLELGMTSSVTSQGRQEGRSTVIGLWLNVAGVVGGAGWF